MPYRVTKIRKGRTAHADYPDPHPTTLEEFKSAVSFSSGKTISDFLDYYDANLNDSDWGPIKDDVRAVLEADPWHEEFNADLQEHTIVRDWGTEDLFWAYNDATTGIPWESESPLVEILGQNGKTVD